MSRTLGIKLGTIALLILLLLIPLSMIEGLVEERQALRDEVLQDIARSSSYSQQLTGPLLVVPYLKTIRSWQVAETIGADGKVVAARERVEKQVPGRLYFLPEQFALNGKINLSTRYRGIYAARLYAAQNDISGHFVLPERFGIREDFADYQFEPAFIALGISDIRGIRNGLQLQFNGQSVTFEPGSQVKLLGNGVHATLPALNAQQPGKLAFAIELALQGSGRLDIVPVGRESNVTLRANWPHPRFDGSFLPVTHQVKADGFTAQWQTSFFATNLEEALQTCVGKGECEAFSSRSFGVSFIDPVDQYLKSDRAIKYALLFIALTFAGFFLFEVLKRLAVHPVQYGLVGMALALFYLLLLSLAEHLPFASAYVIAATACVLLLAVYLSSVLRSLMRGGVFAASLGALYALLYGLLSAEDYALLMGSLLVFGLLAGVMLLTRKLDWYGLGKTL